MNNTYYSEIPSQQLNQTSSMSNTNINNIPVNNTNEDINTNNDNKKLSHINKIKTFLLSPTGTLLTVSFGIAIGNTFKDLISSFIVNILEPIIIFFISKTYLNKYYDLTSFISPQNNVLNIKLFISSFVTFLLVIITVYIIHNTFKLSI